MTKQALLWHNLPQNLLDNLAKIIRTHCYAYITRDGYITLLRFRRKRIIFLSFFSSLQRFKMCMFLHPVFSVHTYNFFFHYIFVFKFVCILYASLY